MVFIQIQAFLCRFEYIKWRQYRNPNVEPLMNPCPCFETGCVDRSAGHYVRPRLFNWITILLLTGWIGLVAITAESVGEAPKPTSASALVDSLIQ
jgi:hypothetical protein